RLSRRQQFRRSDVHEVAYRPGVLSRAAGAPSADSQDRADLTHPVRPSRPPGGGIGDRRGAARLAAGGLSDRGRRSLKPSQRWRVTVPPYITVWTPSTVRSFVRSANESTSAEPRTVPVAPPPTQPASSIFPVTRSPW